MNVINALEWRYATKKFDADKILPQEKIETLKKAFNLTATSYGLQPVRMLVIHNKKIQKQLKEYSWNQPQVEDASHVLVFCIEEKIDSDYIVDYFERVREVRKTPREVLDPFKEFLVKDFSTRSDEEVQQWSAKQAYIAMGNLMTVCALEGIDACPMEGFQPEKYDELLNLQSKNLRSVLVMPVGYRADDDQFAGFKKVRKELDQSILEVQ
ncbi:NAD(P)H-dependent oxidoreductase [Robertkochia aurantiaca]|uniref:NAD(P)H-dependent oxidoreductase n=1 Tax=Robertkochia aurantiaca TaxID=2873700 RepID=UPI001CCC6443|nr:NAD(P)H-dependent oxidoreductase [Robertkochia sp. 3YJGBD-33]